MKKRLLIITILASLSILGCGDKTTGNKPIQITSSIISKPSAIDSIPSLKEIKFLWDPVLGAEGYNIYRGMNKKDLTLIKKGLKQSGFVDYNLNSDTIYYYQIEAFKGLELNISDILEIKTKPLPKLISPENIEVEFDSNEIRLIWDDVEGAEGYNIYRSKSKSNLELIAKDIKIFLYVDSNLESNSNYYYQIEAFNKNEKIKGNIIEVSTLK